MVAKTPRKAEKPPKAAPKPPEKLVQQEFPLGPVPPTLGGKLMEMIENRGLTVSRAAEMADMPRQQLWRILQGDVPNPGVLTVQNVVRALGYRMRELFADGELVRGGLRTSQGVPDEPPQKKKKT